MQAFQITTIITTYKRPHLLRKAVESVLAQTYPHFQLLILDDASKDGTKEIAQAFKRKDPRVKYIEHKENLEMIHNYAYGFSQIHTPYFHFLSDDDTILPNFYNEAMETFTKYPEIGCYAGAATILLGEKKMIGSPNDYWARDGYWEKKEAALEMVGKFPVPSTVVFATSVLNHVSPDYTNPGFWDCDFLIQIALRYPIYLSKNPAGFFLSHNGSFSKKLPYFLIKQGHLNILNRIPNEDEDNKLLKDKLHNFFRFIYRKCFIDSLVLKKWDEAGKCLQDLKNHHFNCFLEQMCYLSIKKAPFLIKVLPMIRITRRAIKKWLGLLSIKKLSSMPKKKGLFRSSLCR